MSTFSVRALALAGSCAALLVGALPAAADVVRPVPCTVPQVTDKTGDATNTLEPADNASVPVPFGQRPPSMDVTGAFLRFEPNGSGGGTTSYNIMIKDLSTTVPLLHTSINWTGYFTTPDGNLRFVRALVDLTGAVVYEYGTYMPPSQTQPIGINSVQGTITGHLFTGPNGLVELDLPASLATPGSTLSAIYAIAAEGRGLPAAAPGYPSRGLADTLDTAPDDGAAGEAAFTVAACPPPV
jgi:hypothetical protein